MFEETRVVQMFGWRIYSRGSLGKAKAGWQIRPVHMFSTDFSVEVGCKKTTQEAEKLLEV